MLETCSSAKASGSMVLPGTARRLHPRASGASGETAAHRIAGASVRPTHAALGNAGSETPFHNTQSASLGIEGILQGGYSVHDTVRVHASPSAPPLPCTWIPSP